uniref:Uncharacterized protein LOC113797270 n=1 Tax=Dermatophagoides pteronyssinus TaxID=6956 RepID=A0A6P6YEV4_DERPT
NDEIQIKPNHKLPKSLQISSIGTHFYRYGIHFYCPTFIIENFNHYKRYWYYNPLFIMIMELIYLFRSMIAFFLSTESAENRQYFIYLGDYMYCIGAKTHINLAAICYMLIGICLLTLNIYNHQHGMRPTFLYSLGFLAGRQTPSSSHLNDYRYIRKMLTKTRWIINYCEINTRTVGIVSFILSAWPLWFECTTEEFLLYGLPWSIIFAISSFFTFSAYFWNAAYFYILCNYLCYQLREINDLISNFILRLKLIEKQQQQQQSIGQQQQQQRRKQSLNKHSIRSLRMNLNRIGKDIEHFNTNYYRDVIFITIALMGTFGNVVLYTALFVPVDLTIRFSLFYAVLLSTSVICWILNIASLVYNESVVTRNVLNKLYVSQIQYHRPDTLYNILQAIEGQSKQHMGFYFHFIFIINSSRFFEV